MLINRVRENRERIKFTQEALANALNVSRQTIISIESGKYTASLELALKLARYFNVTVENLFLLEGKNED